VKATRSADLDQLDVHEARALVRGVDECRCATCKRTRKQIAQFEQNEGVTVPEECGGVQ
jgi:hypothetical protein